MSRISCVLVLMVLATYSYVAKCELNANATAVRRGARQMDIPRDLRLMRVFYDQNQHMRRPPQIAARSDHFPQRIGPGPGPGQYGRPPFGRPQQQAPISYIRRRVYSGPPGAPPPGVFLRPNGPPQYNNYLSMKNSRYPLDKGPYAQKGSPVSYYRQGQGQGQIAPIVNAITHPQGPNFKPSPIYNGEVIVRHPTAAPLVGAPPQQSHPQQQHPEEMINTQRQYKPQANRPAFDSHHTYSVYEDTENEQENSFPHPNIGENAMKEAKHYLNFMSSSEYFLPKIEPDYRKLDQAKQQQLSQSPALNTFQTQQQKQLQQRNSESGNLNAAFTVNAPLRVAASSLQSKTQAHQSSGNSISPTSAYPSRHPAHSNLGSYQADSNVFVVNSDGMKNVHHVVSTSSSYPEGNKQQQQKSLPTFSSGLRPMVKDRVPDPERVEFTERDAIHVSYTSNPMDSMARYSDKHQKQQQLSQQQQQSQADRRYLNPTPSHEEDEDEMMQSSSDIYGRVKVNPTDIAPNPTVEQKDSEEYCERICSNVQDEDEEVVCGSDGFMYTSEAQMECYASCLHIDVTIQSKGTCNQSL